MRALQEEIHRLHSRDRQWNAAIEQLEDQNRYLQWHVQLEKAERMKQDSEVIMMRRELGPDKVAALRNRLKVPSVKVCFFHVVFRDIGPTDTMCHFLANTLVYVDTHWQA